MIFQRMVLVTCICGLFPLEQSLHHDAQSAWDAAAKHVSLNPTKCKPSMTESYEPVLPVLESA